MNELDIKIGKALQELREEREKKKKEKNFQGVPETISFSNTQIAETVSQYIKKRNEELSRCRNASTGIYK
jgi:actin-like ATPase involved in cell morphogenesis